VNLRVGAATIATLILATTAVQAANEKPSADVIARGKMLVTFGGCHDCHTPKTFGPQGMGFDMTRQLSGHQAGSKLPTLDKQALTPGYWVLMGGDLQTFVGPWGISYAANLTPDDQTGIGLWTEEIFLKTIKTGKHMGEGRPLLPPMFTENIRVLPDTDLKAMYAYLRSIPAVKNVVPQPVAPPDVK
jgi:hypothetical protein